MVEIKPDVHPLLAELWITAPDLALSLASRQGRRSGCTVVLPTIAAAFESIDAAMTIAAAGADLQSHEDH